jgi:hypothetical protein
VAWGRPEGDKEVVVPFPHGNFPNGRTAAVDPNGTLIAATRIVNVTTRKQSLGLRELPVGDPCRFKPMSRDTLQGISACSRDWHAVREVQGMMPWFASTKEEWFDPERHRSPDLQVLSSQGH